MKSLPVCEKSKLDEEIQNKIRKDNCLADKTGKKKLRWNYLITLNKLGTARENLILKQWQQRHYLTLFAEALWLYQYRSFLTHRRILEEIWNFPLFSYITPICQWIRWSWHPLRKEWCLYDYFNHFNVRRVMTMWTLSPRKLSRPDKCNLSKDMIKIDVGSTWWQQKWFSTKIWLKCQCRGQNYENNSVDTLVRATVTPKKFLNLQVPFMLTFPWILRCSSINTQVSVLQDDSTIGLCKSPQEAQTHLKQEGKISKYLES